MATKKGVKKSASKPHSVDAREVSHGALLMADVGSRITTQDCAAYSVLIFNRGDAPEEWQKLGVEALSKFAEFGWATFHALQGLEIDWDQMGENVLAKLKKLPRKSKPEPK